jgi:hypothetical protein
MADDKTKTDTPFLKRWSQRKLAASRESATPPAPAVSAANPPTVAEPSAKASPATAVESAAPTLPPIDSLSFDSDFAAFLQPKVDEALKRQALRKLFSDPRFNVMDGLDVYIDDYNKFEPISPDLVAQLNQAKFLFNPPKTRVNEHGHVEDVPDEPRAETVAEASEVEAAPPAQIVDNATNVPPAETALPPTKLPAPRGPDET